MAELIVPASHLDGQGNQMTAVLNTDTSTPFQQGTTRLKIEGAKNIKVTWTYYLGNNGIRALWGDQYCKFTWPYKGETLFEYKPLEGVVRDYFLEEFGVPCQLLDKDGVEVKEASPSTIGVEPLITSYKAPVNYGLPRTYTLILPGPEESPELRNWWRDAAKEQRYRWMPGDADKSSRFSMFFSYYQLAVENGAFAIDRQILPVPFDAEGNWVSAATFGLLGRNKEVTQLFHKYWDIIKVLWEEEGA